MTEEKNVLEKEIVKTTHENIGEFKLNLITLAERYRKTRDFIKLYKKDLRSIEIECHNSGISVEVLKAYVLSLDIKNDNDFQFDLLADTMNEEM